MFDISFLGVEAETTEGKDRCRRGRKESEDAAGTDMVNGSKEPLRAFSGAFHCWRPSRVTRLRARPDRRVYLEARLVTGTWNKLTTRQKDCLAGKQVGRYVSAVLVQSWHL